MKKEKWIPRLYETVWSISIGSYYLCVFKTKVYSKYKLTNCFRTKREATEKLEEIKRILE